MSLMTANWINRVPDQYSFISTMTVKENIYHDISMLDSPQKIKRLISSVYLYDTYEVKKAATIGSNIGQHLNRSLLSNLGSAISRAGCYYQTIQKFCECVQLDFPDIQMVSRSCRQRSSE